VLIVDPSSPNPDRAGGDAVFDRYARLATRLLGAASAVVCLADGGSVRVVGAEGAGRNAPPEVEPLCRQVVETGARVAVSGSFLGVPLVAGGKTLGALAVFDTERPGWGPSDADALADLADLAAVEADRAVGAVEDAQEQVFRILESITDAFFVLDRGWRFTYLNHQAERLLRRGRDELAGRVIWDEFPESVGSDFERAYREASGSGRVVTFEAFYPPLAIWVEVRAYPSEDGLSVYFRDVTDRHATGEALKRSEERFRSLVEAAAAIVWTTAASGEVVADQPGWTAYTGQASEACRGRGWLDAVHPDERAATEASWALALREQTTYRAEHRLRRHDGDYRQMIVHAVPIRDGGGDLREWVGVHKDVTEARRAEEAARRAEERFRLLVQNSSDILTSLDAEGTVLYQSPSVARVLGYPAAERIGRNVFRDPITHPDDLGAKRAFFEAALARPGETVTGRFRLRHASGTYRDIEAVATNRLDDPAVAGIVANYRDVTERRQFEEALTLALDEAEAAGRAKDQFLAVLSHELRNPLNPVLVGVSALLDDPETPASVRPTLELARRNVTLEARLIDDLLDVTRIREGKLRLARQTVDAHELVREALAICRDDIEAGDFRLDMDLAAPRSHVEADPARLQQVFWNLFKNAAKFTPAGGTIAVRSRTAPADGPGLPPGLEVTVSDSGVGIAPEALPRIFNAFEQGDPAVTKQFGGLGLGLAICRSLAEAHGGRLSAESAGRGRGATFRLTLPTAEALYQGATHRAPAATPTRATHPLRILLAEDNLDTLTLMTRLLRRRGHRVSPAASVAQALAAAAADGPYDLLISDIGLPDGTGLDLMQKVGALGPIRGIALSGFGMDGDLRRAREAGFSAQITKPIDFPNLEDVIRQVVAGGI